jgi:predicted O-methyltransferase YrrM
MRTLCSRALRKVASVIGPTTGQIDIADEYVKWLCFANAGMLDRGNLYLMDYAINQLPSNAPIVEIGSFCGLSTNLLTHYKRKHKRTNRLVTCDKWDFEGATSQNVGESPVSFARYKQLVRESFLRNTKVFSSGDLPYTVELLSKEFFIHWRRNETVEDVFDRTITLGGSLSFCYIDGDHSYEGVKQDFENCDEFLEPGGFILFDDAVLREFGVQRLMPEVQATGRYKLVARNPNYLFQKLMHTADTRRLSTST